MTRRSFFVCIIFFLAGATVAWFVRPMWSALDASTSSSFLSVSDVFQSTNYSCGASGLQAILAYWGTEVHESELMKALGTSEEVGTDPESILRVARSYGLSARMREGATVQEIAAAVADNVPVILDIQAWPEPSSGSLRWDADWEDGHYVIALGLDGTNLYVEDPSLLGCRGFIPLKEFESRWHDYEGDPPYNSAKRSYVRMAMFIEGKDRASSPPLCRVN
jgi:uncharacterized protein